MYKTGIETKQQIIQCAKELFYENGYKNTSVSQICHASDTKLGTFTYYFPKKNDLLNYLYAEYMQKCNDFIDRSHLDLSSPEHHIYTVMFYYMRLYSDEAIVRFHQEVLSIGSMNMWFQNPRTLISDFSGTKRDEALYSLFVNADNAVRRELNLNFIQSGKRDPESIRALMKDIYTINAKLFDIDLDELDVWLNHAFRFAKRNLKEPVSLLEPSNAN